MFENPKISLRKLCISCAKIACCSSELIFSFLYADSRIQNANEQLLSCIHLSFVILALHINPQTKSNGSYVYWTVHHLDSWVKRDQLDATCFIITLFSAQHVSDVNTSILRSLRLIRRVSSWVVSGSMYVGVPLQCGYGGVVSVCSLKHFSASDCIRIPHHHSHTATEHQHTSNQIQPMK